MDTWFTSPRISSTRVTETRHPSFFQFQDAIVRLLLATSALIQRFGKLESLPRHTKPSKQHASHTKSSSTQAHYP